MMSMDGQAKILFSILKVDVAKVVNLSEENEPDIFRAIKRGHFRKCCFKEGTNEVDFEDVSITPNTRVSYPIFPY
jgi:phosphoenolpyruvate carboxykinase (ATP)